MTTLDATTRNHLSRRARLLAGASVGDNLLEAVTAMNTPRAELPTTTARPADTP